MQSILLVSQSMDPLHLPFPVISSLTVKIMVIMLSASVPSYVGIHKLKKTIIVVSIGVKCPHKILSKLVNRNSAKNTMTVLTPTVFSMKG